MPDLSSSVMREEIFGPLIPVIEVDSVDAADTAADALSETNRIYGRRFEIVRFRWLSADEV